MMPVSSRIRKKIDSAFPQAAKPAREIARSLHRHPEIAFHEHRSSELICRILESAGFRIRRGIGGMPTAFRAEWGGGNRKAVCLIAEYDALPNLGHACGHNLIAGSAAGAALALTRAVSSRAGRIVVLGTPAEETLGGKINLLRAGAFSGIGAVLLAHPSHQTRVHSSSLALVNSIVEFQGRSAHASATPEKGINALEALILLFNSLAWLKGRLPPGSRIDGVILEGGIVPNVIPDRTRASFYLRARELPLLAALRTHFAACVRAAERASGARARISQPGPIYAPFLSSPTLENIFRESLQISGFPLPEQGKLEALGSSDIGNVSQKIPSLHPTYAITSREIGEHSPEFAQIAGSEGAFRKMLKMARVLAYTAGSLIEKPESLQRAGREHRKLIRIGEAPRISRK